MTGWDFNLRIECGDGADDKGCDDGIGEDGVNADGRADGLKR